MKYFVIEISTGDAMIAGKAVYSYDNKNDAIATFHQKLSTAMKSELFETEQVLVIDSENGILCMEKYVKDTTE